MNLDNFIPAARGYPEFFSYAFLRRESGEIVKGYRGVHGGYSLNRGLDELTLYEVYSAIDPDMFIIECLDPKYNCVRDGQDGLPCLVHRELLSVQDELISLLKRNTIQQIMEEA